MAASATRVKVTYQAYGFLEFTVTFYVAGGIVNPNDATIQAIITAINAVTRAVAIRIELSASEGHAVTATASATYVNEDKAEFVFQGDADGLAHTFKVPGLHPAILATDNENIDATAGLPLAYVAAVAANALDADGGSLTAPTKGRRRAARKQLKK